MATKQPEQELRAYLRELGFGPTEIKRSLRIKKLFEQVCGEPIVGHFASGKEIPPSNLLVFFTENYWLEASNFLADYRLEMTFFHKQISSVEIRSEDYDFEAAIPNSTLEIRAHLLQNTVFMLRLLASGKNCDHLLRVYSEQIRPQLCTKESACCTGAQESGR